MALESKIEWCDATINFWWGCTKVSPGCSNCYAESVEARWGQGDSHWGKGAPRRKIKSAVADAFKLNRKAEKEGRRLKVFSLSMGDWLDPEVPIEWFVEMLDTIRSTPHLDWLLLTKRPELWEQRICAVADYTGPESCPREWKYLYVTASNMLGEIGEGKYRLPNVWIGTSVEDQRRADERIPELLKIPAAMRFLSCEPLLGEVDILKNLIFYGDEGTSGYMPGLIDWVIVGGESGSGAREMRIPWAQSLKIQSYVAGIPFFMKQLGGVRNKWGNLKDFPEDLRVREFPELEAVK